MRQPIVELIWSFWHEEGGLVQTIPVIVLGILSVLGGWALLLLIKKLVRQLFFVNHNLG
jgi:hypothetical protein